MTVQSTAVPRKTYDGNDLTTNFPITFPYNDDETLIVVVHVDASDVETTWTLNGGGDTGYTVVADEVVANTAPATGTRLVLYRSTPIKQLIDLITNQAYSANVLEAALDKLTLICQELDDSGTVLGLTLPVTVDDAVSGELPLPEANTFLSWNATATALINAAAQVGGATVTSYMATLLDDANAAAARGTLGIDTDDDFECQDLTLNGSVFWKKGIDVASDATLDLTGDGNIFDITGTDTITSIDTKGLNAVCLVQFDGAVPFTHHATNLVLNAGGANYTTSAGDRALLWEYDTGKWFVTFMPANGKPVVPDLAPTGGGTKVLLGTKIASASASLDFVDGETDDAGQTIIIDGTYDRYVVEFENILAGTGGEDLIMRFAISDVFQSGAGDYTFLADGGSIDGSGNYAANNGGDFTSAQIYMTRTTVSATAKVPLNGDINVYNPSGTDQYCSAYGFTHYTDSTDVDETKVSHVGGVFHESKAATPSEVNGIQVLMTGGVITSGTARLYGINKGG